MAGEESNDNNVFERNSIGVAMTNEVGGGGGEETGAGRGRDTGRVDAGGPLPYNRVRKLAGRLGGSSVR